MKINQNSLILLGLAAVGVMMAGCKDPNDDLATTSPTAPKLAADYKPMAKAGVTKDVSKSLVENTIRWKGLINSSSKWGSRGNPFSLSKDEIAFDQAQAAEKIVIDGGNFGSLYELTESKLPGEGVQVEPQPYRRLSGILIGDSVLAILEEGGKSTIVRPGMMIPDTNWRVVSIDKDKAILRREGPQLPHEVEVRLEVGMPGFTNTGNQGGGGTPPPGRGGKNGGPGGMSAGSD